MCSRKQKPEEAAEEESSTPYWTEETEVDGTTQTVTHAVLDSNGNPVDIGAEPPALDTENLEEGNMTAQKFGAFEDEEDAENGIVKLTFDVAGKPVEVETPVDMLIVGDESGSMNMYGRADTASGSTSYMPCLNDEHYYKVDDLQKSLYEGDNAKVDSELKGMSKDLVKQINEAMQKDAAPSEGETDAPSAVEAIRSAKSQKVADAQTASSAADESANAAKAALDAAQAAYDAASEEEKAEMEAALKTAQSTYDGAAKAAEKAKTALTSAEKDLAAADKVISLLQKKAENAEKIANCESSTFYLNPHEYGLENIVFKQWADGENADVVIDLVEKAGYVIPEGMTAAEVLARLFPDKTNPLDKNHYYYDSETGTYVEIPYVTNNTIIEEDNGKLYSYWSPEYDNKTGCLDRMMLEKLAAAGLAESILENENSFRWLYRFY